MNWENFVSPNIFDLDMQMGIKRYMLTSRTRVLVVTFISTISEKDGYGNEVSRLARPLPVEYLLVDIPASTPLVPLYTFHAGDNVRPFPVENRLVDGHIQDFSALSRYMEQFSREQFLEAVSDFHFLLYIASMEMLPMQEFMQPLVDAVKSHDEDGAIEWSRSDHWATVEQLIAASGSSPPPSRPESAAAGASATPAATPWTCPHCTFINPPELGSCDMCSLPRMSA